ncbi:hypothetical protein [Ammoniphilus sp. 3BR4]|uniref:hypothetical protein n=1 Tax=Ammoniphilus sp. 3BR4 TaxID=3158265 RepID=UPI0034674A66
MDHFVQIINFEDRMEFTGFYLLKSADIKQTSDSRNYFDMVICDSTGEVPLKFWDVSDLD